MSEGYVYFMQRPSDGLIKIGRSANPSVRKRQLQHQHGEELSVLFVVKTEDAVYLEKAIHDFFNTHRFTGEWFHITKQQAESLIHANDLDLVLFEECNQGRCRIAFDTYDSIRYGLRLRSVKTGKSISEILTELCEESLQEEMHEYQKHTPETTADPRGRKKKHPAQP